MVLMLVRRADAPPGVYDECDIDADQPLVSCWPGVCAVVCDTAWYPLDRGTTCATLGVTDATTLTLYSDVDCWSVCSTCADAGRHVAATRIGLHHSQCTACAAARPALIADFEAALVGCWVHGDIEEAQAMAHAANTSTVAGWWQWLHARATPGDATADDGSQVRASVPHVADALATVMLCDLVLRVRECDNVDSVRARLSLMTENALDAVLPYAVSHALAAAYDTPAAARVTTWYAACERALAGVSEVSLPNGGAASKLPYMPGVTTLHATYKDVFATTGALPNVRRIDTPALCVNSGFLPNRVRWESMTKDTQIHNAAAVLDAFPTMCGCFIGCWTDVSTLAALQAVPHVDTFNVAVFHQSNEDVAAIVAALRHARVLRATFDARHMRALLDGATSVTALGLFNSGDDTEAATYASRVMPNLQTLVIRSMATTLRHDSVRVMASHWHALHTLKLFGVELCEDCVDVARKIGNVPTLRCLHWGVSAPDDARRSGDLMRALAEGVAPLQCVQIDCDVPAATLYPLLRKPTMRVARVCVRQRYTLCFCANVVALVRAFPQVYVCVNADPFSMLPMHVVAQAPSLPVMPTALVA